MKIQLASASGEYETENAIEARYNKKQKSKENYSQEIWPRV